MSKRWLLNVALLGLILALAAIAFLQPGIEKSTVLPLIANLKAAEVNRIVIARGRATEILLQREEGEWKMAQPVPGRTNLFAVNDVLRVLSANNQQSFPPDAAKQLDRYGLAKPRGRVRLNQLEILFGDTNPVSKLQYIYVQNRVVMIDSAYFWITARTYGDYLSKRLIENNRRPVALSLPDARLALENGIWQTYPVQKELSADRVKILVDQWRYAQALSVGKYRNARVLDWVRVSFENEKSKLRIGILSRSPELILYRPDEKLQYHFPEEAGKRLFQLQH